VFGANLYDRYLSRRNVKESKRIANLERSIEELLGSDTSDWDHDAESCSSILVQVSFVSLQCTVASDFLKVSENNGSLK
jgi:hypothetical protein